MYENAFGYNEKLPEEIRDIFMWLCQDVVSLQRTWDFYQELFNDEQNTELLSELALSSFQIIEESLRTEMTMAIGRLSDPSNMRKNDNLSLSLLADRCPYIPGLDKLLADFGDVCSPIIKLRHKRIAHNDLDSIIYPREYPIQGFGKNQIDLILELASSILKVTIRHFDNVDMTFHMLTPSGGKSLIRQVQWELAWYPPDMGVR